MEPLDRTRPKTAFVFAGGGSFGAVQVGMLRSLVSHGLNADLVVGSSVGAMNGAYYAGTPTAEGVEGLARIWRGLRRQDVFPVRWRDWLGFVRRRDFLVRTEGLHRLVHTHLPYSNLQDAQIRCTSLRPISCPARPSLSRKVPLRRPLSPAPRFPLPSRPCKSMVSTSPLALSRAAHRFIKPSRAARRA